MTNLLFILTKLSLMIYRCTPRRTRLYRHPRLIPRGNLPAPGNLPAHETGFTPGDHIMVYPVPEVPRGDFPWKMEVQTTFQLALVPFPFPDLLPPGVPLGGLTLGDHQGGLPLITY